MHAIHMCVLCAPPLSPAGGPFRYGRPVEDPCERLGSETACRLAMEAAGFPPASIHVWREQMVNTTERSARQYAEGIWANVANNPFAPVGALWSEAVVARMREEFVQRAEAMAAARVDGGVLSTPTTYLVTKAVKAAC